MLFPVFTGYYHQYKESGPVQLTHAMHVKIDTRMALLSIINKIASVILIGY